MKYFTALLTTKLETYPDAVHLGKHPVLGSIQSLQVLLRTSGLRKTKHSSQVEFS